MLINLLFKCDKGTDHSPNRSVPFLVEKYAFEASKWRFW